MADSRKSWGIWLAYLPVSLILFVLFLKDFTFYAQFPPAYLLLLILAVIIGLNPIRHQYTYYSFIGGLSFKYFFIKNLAKKNPITSPATRPIIHHNIFANILSIFLSISILLFFLNLYKSFC